MRLLVVFLVLTSCAVSPPEMRTTGSETRQIADRLRSVAAESIAALHTIEQANAPSRERGTAGEAFNKASDLFATPIRSLDALAAWAQNADSALRSIQPPERLARAMDSLLEVLAEDGMPQELRMAPEFREKLVRGLSESDTSSSWKLSRRFVEHIAQALTRETEALTKNFEALGAELQSRSVLTSTSLYLDGLRKRRDALRDAVLRDLHGELPQGWDPAPELVVVEELLRNVLAEKALEATQKTNWTETLHKISLELQAISHSLANWSAD